MNFDAEWFEPEQVLVDEERHHAGRFLVAPATGPQIWDVTPLTRLTPGRSLYMVFMAVCRKWDGALLSNLERSAEYDADLVERVHPGAVFAVVTRSLELAVLTEDERKNLSSQSRSHDNSTDSTAENATVQTDTSPEESP